MTATAPAAPAKVYFTNLRTHARESQLDKLKRLIRHAGIEQIDFENKFVAIKIHFGEMCIRDSNCILQLLAYDKGTIELFGEPMTPARYDLKRRIGVVPQQVAVFGELTVRENIDYFCSLYINDRKRRRALVDEAIDFVGLGDFTKFRPGKLSGGLARRLNIACGIAHKPELIFFDEPTVAVDPQSRNAILELSLIHI